MRHRRFLYRGILKWSVGDTGHGARQRLRCGGEARCKNHTMGFTLVRLPDEPIIIVNIRLPIRDHREAIAQLDDTARRLIDECGCAIYSIVTIGDQDLTFSDILLFISEQRAGRSGSLLDLNVHVLLVGTHPLLASGVEHFQREFGIIVPLFATVDEAVAHARARIKRSSSHTASSPSAASDSPAPPESDADPPPA
jgi:hypothetical protein